MYTLLTQTQFNFYCTTYYNDLVNKWEPKLEETRRKCVENANIPVSKIFPQWSRYLTENNNRHKSKSTDRWYSANPESYDPKKIVPHFCGT